MLSDQFRSVQISSVQIRSDKKKTLTFLSPSQVAAVVVVHVEEAVEVNRLKSTVNKMLNLSPRMWRMWGLKCEDHRERLEQIPWCFQITSVVSNQVWSPGQWAMSTFHTRLLRINTNFTPELQLLRLKILGQYYSYYHCSCFTFRIFIFYNTKYILTILIDVD